MSPGESPIFPRRLPDVWRVLERIRRTIRVEHSQFAEMLRLTERQYAALRSRDAVPSTYSVYSLADNLHLTFENLIRGKIDFQALGASYLKGAEVLPERYAIGAHSKRRTSINVLAYIEAQYGWFEKECLLRHFQMREQVFNHPDDRISIRFLTDLLDHLRARGLGDRDFGAMGSFGAVTNRGSPFARELSKEPKVDRLYERFFTELIHNYDENYSYKIARMRDGKLTFQCHERPEVAEALALRHIGSPTVCLVKAASAGAVSALAGFGHTPVRESQCIHRGDPSCLFELDCEFTQAVSRARTTAPSPHMH